MAVRFRPWILRFLCGLYLLPAVMVLADLGLHGWTSRVLRLVPLPVLIVSLIPAVVLLFNLASFRPAYSVLGPRCRRSPPADATLLAECSMTSGRVGWFVSGTTPFFGWSVYDQGIGYRIMIFRRGWIPFSDVTLMQRGSLVRGGIVGHSWGVSVVHRNPEIRSPIVLYGDEVCQALLELWPQLSQDADASASVRSSSSDRP